MFGGRDDDNNEDEVEGGELGCSDARTGERLTVQAWWSYGGVLKVLLK